MARVLVAARHVALDRTSEGLCTARFLQALAAGGHDVRCVTSEDGDPGWRSDGVELRPWPPPPRSGWDLLDRWTGPGQGPRPLAFARRHARTALTVTSGRAPQAWRERAQWRQALDDQLVDFRPEVVVARGGGLGFEVHHLLAGRSHAPPWVAHVHDPFPASAYPPSYAERTPLLSAHEERSARRVLRRADVVTAPSERLASWMSRTIGASLGDRLVVVPHVGGPTSDGAPDRALVDRLCGDRPLLLVHTGTLLRQRSPRALLEALDRLAARSPVWADQARLVLLGRLDRRHRADPALQEVVGRLEAAGCLRVHDGRAHHATALAVTERATAAVLIEADDPESPFFPAKLADYVASDRPVLALTPGRSVARDLLGDAHPLLVTPGDRDGVVRALEAVREAWAGDALDPLRPRPEARALVSAGHARDVADECIERARSR